jgi:hypothetical protein
MMRIKTTIIAAALALGTLAAASITTTASAEARGFGERSVAA